jgi:intein/homing endonuclease/glycosyltransferase involved in cell wall biosynthesis
MATKPQKLKNLLFFGDFGCTTGFGNVSKELIENWAKDKNLKIVVFAINNFEKEPYDYLPNVKVIPAMSTVLADEPKDDFYCRLQFLRLLMHNDFDVVFCLNDIEIFNEMGEHLKNVKIEKRKQNKPNFKSMVYFPIDSEPRPSDLKILEFFDEVITYTEYAKKVLTPLTTPSNAKKIKVIPHGCNTNNFYPISDEEKLKAKLEILGEGNEETFLFGTVNRNSVRKDLASLILGFSTFIRNESKPNAVLYLHCNPLDPAGVNIFRLCDRVGLRVGVDVILPKEFSENKGYDEAQLNRIYNAFDCFITTTTAEGWGLCLESFTKIPTIKGVKNIKDVMVGDMVLGNSGNYHKVLDTTFRSVKELINVKTQYGYEVKATIEHPYFVYSDLKKEGIFKRLKDVEVGNYLGIVKPKGDKPLLDSYDDSLDLINYIDTNDINFIIEDDFISNKFAYSPKNKKWSISEISKKYNVSKSISESAKERLNYGVSKKSIEVLKLCENLISDGYVKPNSIKTNRFLKLNDELLYLIGWYLAEGSCENGIRVEFSLNIDELDIANELKRIIENAFGISDCIIREMETKCALRISNKIVAQFFKNTCGQGALNKKIPFFLIGSEKKLMPLVKGYVEGDGHIRFNRNHVSFSTISPSLAFQMQSILNSNGIFLGCTKLSKRGVGRYDSYKCIIPNHYVQKYMDLVGYDFDLKRNSTRNHKSNIIENETHFFVKIKEITKIENKTDVYDLCVENTHSFVGNGLVCHNTVTEAMATKTLVICPQHTSLSEITNFGDNSISFMFNQATVFVNDFEKIRFTTNPHEVTNLMGIVYNLKHEEEDVRLLAEQKIELAYEKVKSMKWEVIAKQFKEKIDKLAK